MRTINILISFAIALAFCSAPSLLAEPRNQSVADVAIPDVVGQDDVFPDIVITKDLEPFSMFILMDKEVSLIPSSVGRFSSLMALFAA